MSKTVVVFGEALWDLLPGGPQLGGAPLNFACRLHALGKHTLLVSRVGRDGYGDKARARLAELGVDVSGVQIDDQHPTGTVNVTVDAAGNPSFQIVPGVAFDFIEPVGSLIQPARGADLIYFGTLIQRSSVSRTTLHGLIDEGVNSTMFLDLNLRPKCFTKNTILRSLDRADILKLNEHEVNALAELASVPASSLRGFCEAAIKRWSLQTCVVTLGERGAFAASAGGEQVYCPGYLVDVADTCGSGDAFAAGFAHAWLEGAPLVNCCRLGCQLGAIVATQPGGTTPVSNEQLRAFRTSPHPLIRQSDLERFESD